jgi:RNA polymerase sigma-70 factor, ECF subfamily
MTFAPCGGHHPVMSSAEQLALPRDEPAFAALFERHRGELRVHCYRMLGSLEDSEDLVQETFLRAWRGRTGFSGGRSALRAWLYRIATNACLDVLRTRPRRVTPPQVADPADPEAPIPPPTDLPWLQPYPDRLLESVAALGEEPGAAVVARETLELAFLAAIQHLPPRQRAALILRDVVGWSAKETAHQLETSVASVNSALQRARATLSRVNLDATGPPVVSAEQRELLGRYVDAFERYDIIGLVSLLREEAIFSMPSCGSGLRAPLDVRRCPRGSGSECRSSRLSADFASVLGG